MIPQFPQFKKLELADRDIIQQLTHSYPPYSDYNFTSLWSWNTKNEAQFSILNGNLAIKFNDYVTGEPFYSYLGNKQVNETAKQLLQLAKDEDLMPVLKLLPEQSITDLSLEIYNITEDINNADYIYSIEKLQTYQGGALEDVRNLRNRFVKKYSQIGVRSLDLYSVEGRAIIIQLNQQWENNRGFPLHHEKNAIQRLLDSADHFSLISLVVTVNREPVAFSISEMIDNEFGISHFVKADVRFNGVYAYLMQATADALAQRACKYLNYEQDLGIPGLRRAKSAFRPAYFLKKYSLISKET